MGGRFPGEAENGRQALQRIAELKPGLVFLYLQMPVMNGFEVIQSLIVSKRQSPRHPRSLATGNEGARRLRRSRQRMRHSSTPASRHAKS